jgi:hypothetical protein
MPLHRIHIIGSSPRSGTTLLAEAIHTCFSVDAHCSHEASIAEPPPIRNGVYLSKQPGEILSVRLPLTFDPALRVLCVIRDPRDVCVSRHGSQPDLYWCSMRYWHLFLRQRHWLLRHPRVHCIRYEDLVRNPDAVQHSIGNFMPFLRVTHRFSQYHTVCIASPDSHRALRGVRPITSGSIGAWRSDRARVKHQLTLHGSINDSLIEFGYEPDCQWENELLGIEEASVRTKLPETFDFKYIANRKWRGVVAAARAWKDRVWVERTE